MPKSKILIVDDEPVVRDVCNVVLRKNGYEPILAVDGVEGFATFGQRQEEICLVISDVKMPRMNGIILVRKLFESYGEVNVIMMSGYNNVSDGVPADLQKLCAVLLKPFTSKQLVEAVRKRLNYAGPADEAAATGMRP